AHHDDGDGWKAARRLDANMSGSVLDGPSLAVSPAGNAVAVWRQNGSLALWAARFDARRGVWMPPSTIAAGSWGFVGQYRAAIDDAGDAVVTWSEGRADGSAYVFTSRFDAGGRWSSSETRAMGGSNPVVAMSRSG